MTRSYGFSQEINDRNAAASAATHNIMAMMNGRSRSAYRAVSACDPLVAIVRLEMRLGHGALLTLMTYRGCDSRDSDLAVAGVEVAARSLAFAPLPLQS